MNKTKKLSKKEKKKKNKLVVDIIVNESILTSSFKRYITLLFTPWELDTDQEDHFEDTPCVTVVISNSNLVWTMKTINCTLFKDSHSFKSTQKLSTQLKNKTGCSELSQIGMGRKIISFLIHSPRCHVPSGCLLNSIQDQRMQQEKS